MNKLFLGLLIIVLTGCESISYTTSYNNGFITSEVCSNGDCHTLIGAGTIVYNFNNDTITVSCFNYHPFQYNTSSYRGYNCNTQSFIF